MNSMLFFIIFMKLAQRNNKCKIGYHILISKSHALLLSHLIN